MTQFTEAEKEAIYDAERSGAIYAKPSRDELTAIERDIDQPTSGPWLPVLAITDDPTNDGRSIPIVRSRDAAHREERLLSILERIAALDEPKQSEMLGYAMGLFDGMAAKPAIEIRRVYHDLAHLGDACEDPDAGPLAYTDYALGSDDTQAMISIQADGSCAPEVFLCGHEGIPLSHFLGALANLRTLLADERVQ